eukprot:TRINITY_DN20787_c0_g2_i1.p1 TRINITY_DN20787_c0_g2~~TRINITY_DN20787_c0_g2_i1.p1  ORF type:complete len:766 (-),score=161.80 TRINITY_DN20787_c0_g2_i1:134-2431(-)
MGRLEGGLIYVEAVARSVELLLGQADERLEELEKSEAAALPQELGHCTRELRLHLERLQAQLHRGVACEADAPASSTTCGPQASASPTTSTSDLSEESAKAVEEASDRIGRDPTLIGRSAVGFNSAAGQGSRGCFSGSLLCPGLTSPFLQSSGLGKYASSWSEHVDPASGSTYYYNQTTHKSMWTKPEEATMNTATWTNSEQGKISSGLGGSGPSSFEPNDVFEGSIVVCNSSSLISASASKSPSHSFLIDPRWTTKLAWDFFVMFAVLCDSMILPFQLAFKNTHTDGFDDFWFYWTTTLFVIDMIANFNTAIELDDDGSRPDVLIRDRWLIARKYGRGWFPIDSISTVPWARLVASFASGQSGGTTQIAKLLKVVKFMRLMRLMRMLRMAKLRVIWERVEDEVASVLLVQMITLVRILFIVVAICHWTACVFWMIGNPESLITDLLPDRMAEQFAKTPHWTTVLRSHGPSQETWRWIDRSTTEAYIFCFYWTLGVMRTMPAEVTPVNLAERIFVLLFMFFALSAFAISIASLTQAYFKISERNRNFTDELFAVRMALKRYKVDKVTKRYIKDYLAHLFERRRVMAKETGLMKQLPETLQKEVDRARKLLYLKKLPVLQEFSKASLDEICDISEIRDLLPGQHICRANQEATAACILVAGALQAKSGEYDEPLEFAEAIQVVDNDCLLSEKPVASPYSVVATSVCELLRVDKVKFVKLAMREGGWNAAVSQRSMNVSCGSAMESFQRNYDNAEGSAATAAAVSAG